jgi:transposase InsO family protein
MILVLGVWNLPSRSSRPVRRRHPSELRPAPGIGRPAAVNPSLSAPPPGPRLLGLSLTALDELARQPRPRPPRNGRRKASPRFSALLALEVPTTPTRSPADRPRDPKPDSTDGRAKTPPGAGAGFKPNFASSAMTPAPSPSPSACANPPVTRRLRGKPFWPLTDTRSRLLISSSYLASPSACSSVSWSSATTRRELLHIGVTDQPAAAWAAQQIIHAFPNETGPAYLPRDRDAIYDADFQRRVERMGIRQVVIAPRAPWQNPFAERVIGSIRRECLDPVAIPQVRGLHHRYQRAA